MKKREPVSEIMTKSVISVNKTTNSLRDVKTFIPQRKDSSPTSERWRKNCGYNQQ